MTISLRRPRAGNLTISGFPIPGTGGIPIDIGPRGGGGVDIGPIGITPQFPPRGGPTPRPLAPGVPTGTPVACPDGFELEPLTGRCIRSGAGGMMERMIPGGGTGTLPGPGGVGTPVVGSFGIPALLPMQVGTITRNDGVVSPILRCRAGMVLGKDDLCYVRSTLPRGFRKHPPAPKPPISGSDAKAIRRADSARKRVASLAKKSGFTCKIAGAASPKPRKQATPKPC